jgi:scyllo-inositol 2-dehydrogenase (NADP+)
LAGAVFHAPLIRGVPGLKLAKIVTSRREPVAKDLPEVVAAGIEEVFADPAIDLAVIASPSAHHYEHARAALLAGKNVVVDKPLATTAREASDLIELAASRNRVREANNRSLAFARLGDVNAGDFGTI